MLSTTGLTLSLRCRPVKSGPELLGHDPPSDVVIAHAEDDAALALFDLAKMRYPVGISKVARQVLAEAVDEASEQLGPGERCSSARRDDALLMDGEGRRVRDRVESVVDERAQEMGREAEEGRDVLMDLLVLRAEGW